MVSTGSKYHISDIENTNLEAHVNLSLQRYSTLEEKVTNLGTQMVTIGAEIHKNDEQQLVAINSLQTQYITDINELKLELAEIKQAGMEMHNDVKQHYSTELLSLRDEFFDQSRDTTKVIVGAAATIAAGLLSTIIVMLVTFL